MRFGKAPLVPVRWSDLPATIPCGGWFAGRKVDIPNQEGNCAETGVRVVHVRGNALRFRKRVKRSCSRLLSPNYAVIRGGGECDKVQETVS